jgi:hypothetical protein
VKSLLFVYNFILFLLVALAFLNLRYPYDLPVLAVFGSVGIFLMAITGRRRR